jgi:hypothetical protein
MQHVEIPGFHIPDTKSFVPASKSHGYDAKSAEWQWSRFSEGQYEDTETMEVQICLARPFSGYRQSSASICYCLTKSYPENMMYSLNITTLNSHRIVMIISFPSNGSIQGQAGEKNPSRSHGDTKLRKSRSRITLPVRV